MVLFARQTWHIFRHFAQSWNNSTVNPISIQPMGDDNYPFMLLPIYLSMSEIKNELIEASADLGANNWQTLRFLIIPSCLGDMIYSSIMIGLMAFGEFAIPELLGGAKYSFWGSIIASKFTLLRDFKSGAAYTFVGTVIVLALSGFIYSVTVLFKSLLSSGFKEGFKDK